MRIAFLFNHDQIHQVAHSLPIAIAMAQSGRGVDIVIATTHARLTTEVRLLLERSRIALPVVELGLSSRSGRLFAGTFEALFPATKLAVYRRFAVACPATASCHHLWLGPLGFCRGHAQSGPVQRCRSLPRSLRNRYLRHDGPEHVMAFAPTRSGKGVGLVVSTLLGWSDRSDGAGALWLLNRKSEE